MIDKGTIITSVGILIFSTLISLLFFSQKNTWEMTEANYKRELDSLKNLSFSTKIQEVPLQDTLSTDSIALNNLNLGVYPEKFDPLDKKNFRIYGLLKDEDSVFSSRKLAEKFNVSSFAIKQTEIGGVIWYIVPIKMVHYLQKGETAEGLARKYYNDNKKAYLILDFNKKLNADTWIYIPFN